MKIKYYKEDNMIVFQIGTEAYEYAEMEDDVVVHFTKDKKPVRVEILDADRFFKEQSKALPMEIKQKYFNPSSALYKVAANKKSKGFMVADALVKKTSR